MSRKQRLTFCSILLILMISAMTACSNNDEASGGNGNGAVEEADVHLTMTAWGNPAEINVYQRALDAYMELNPDVSIELNATPGDNYDQQLLTQLSGSTAPDVFYVGDGMISTLAQNGSVLGLSEYLDGPDAYVAEDDFAEGSWGAARLEDEIYGTPVDVNPAVIYYNKGMLEELGIKSPQEYFDEGSWNWDAFLEVTSELKDNGRHGFVQEAGWFGAYSWVWGNGGRVYDEDMNFIGHEDPKTVEAFEFMADNVENGNTVFAGTFPEGQGLDAMFMSNQVGMVAAGRWLTPMFSEVDGLEFDFIPYPTNTGNQTEPGTLATAYLSVNADTDHAEEAMNFVTFYTSEEGQEVRLADTGNAVPSVSGIDHVITDDPFPEHSEYLIEAREIGYATGHPEVIDARLTGFSSERDEQFELLFLGDQDAQTTLNRIEEIVTEMIDEQLR